MIPRRGIDIPIERMLHWCVERENIRKNKDKGLSPPWSSDPILSTYRFCNLRRRDDRVSVWLLNNVLNKCLDVELFTFLQFTALCRWVNWPPTIVGIIDAGLYTTDGLDISAIGAFIDNMCSSKTKTWTGAYMVRAAPKRDFGVLPKGKFVAEVVVGAGMLSVKEALIESVCKAELVGIWKTLCSIKNWGSFMAGQVVADWTYTPLLSQAPDLNSWAPQGPGSVRGYNRMLGLHIKTKAPPMEVWCAQLIAWREAIVLKLGSEYTNVTLHDVQNVLCEFDKYERVRLGEGRPRSLYKPEIAF